MKSLITAFCLILVCGQTSFVLGNDRSGKTRGASKSTGSSKKLVWNANPSEERISCYNVYQRIDNGSEAPYWKKIGTVREPAFTVKGLKKGPNTFAVSACSKSGESPRTELIVTR